MKKTRRFTAALILVLYCILLTAVPALADSSPPSIDYVAFGDSVAAGVRGEVKELSSEYGYTDLLAAKLAAAGVLGDFSEAFCTSGMTAKKLAVNTSVLNNTGSDERLMVERAELATLTIGGNDLLAPLYAYLDTLGGKMPDMAQIKEQLGAVSATVSAVGPAVEADIETILQNILNANKTIRIYVMGYYNPLPAASAMAGVDLNAPLKDFNVYIQKAVSDVVAANPGASVSYVDTMAALAGTSDSLKLQDIHPTEKGYRRIATEFWKQISLLVPAVTADAAPTSASVLVNSGKVAFEAYNIDGSNYFKLRDLAKVLSGTGKQFEISIDSAAKIVNLTSGKAYSPVGEELSQSGNTVSVTAERSAWVVYLDGKQVVQTVYMINGSNYFKLRDLGLAVDFGVGWDAPSSTISIDTTLEYTA
jgi:lysophospholipase L1-like esterase